MPIISGYTVANSSTSRLSSDRSPPPHQNALPIIHNLSAVVNKPSDTSISGQLSISRVYTAHTVRKQTGNINSAQTLSNLCSVITPRKDVHGCQSKSGALPTLLEKKTLYNQFIHYGQNHINAQDMLNELRATLLSEVMKNIHHTEQIKSLLPSLNLLAATLLTLEAREKLTKVELQEVDKKENVVRGLIHAFYTLPDILLKTDPMMINVASVDIKKVLKQELIQSTLKRLLTGKESEDQLQAWKVAIETSINSNQQNIQLRERFNYFISSGYKKLLEPLRKQLRTEIKLIENAISTANSHLIRPERNINTVLSAMGNRIQSSTFIVNVEQVTAKLDRILSDLKVSTEGMSELPFSPAEPFHYPGRWLYPSGMRVSVVSDKVSSIAHDIARPAGDALNKFYSNHINNEKLKPILDRSLTSLSTLSPVNKMWCLKMKGLAEPVQDNAKQLLQVGKQLKKAIKEARKAGIVTLPKPETPEEALLLELSVHIEDTPQIKLNSAIQEAQILTQRILSEPVVALKSSSVSLTTELQKREQKFLDLIQDVSGSLDEAARYLQRAAGQLQETVHPSEYGALQTSINSTLAMVLRNVRHLPDTLNNSLESVTGIHHHSHYEWIHKLETDIRKSWQGLTHLIRKGYHSYHFIPNKNTPNDEEKIFYNQIHQAVLPLLNEVEKLSVSSRRLETALTALKQNEVQGKNAVSIAAEQCRNINLKGIQYAWDMLRPLINKRDIPLYQRGDEQRKKTATLGSVLNGFTDSLLKSRAVLQDASYLGQWLPDGNKISLLLTKLSSQLESLKAGIKDAVEAATGSRVHNNPPEGMIAKDIGEWLTGLKQEYARIHIQTNDADDVIEKIIAHFCQTFATKDDPEGKLFRQRVRLAMLDAEKGNVPWPLTAEELLGRTKSRKDYTLTWAEKSLTYRIESELLLNHTLARMFSPVKHSLIAPLRLLNLMLMPIKMEMTRRAMKKVRPGNTIPTSLIEKYESREYFQNAFRFISMMLPQLQKTIAAMAIVGYGLNEGGEYRNKFLTRAASRLPADIFWISGFAAWRETTHALTASENNLTSEEVIKVQNMLRLIPREVFIPKNRIQRSTQLLPESAVLTHISARDAGGSDRDNTVDIDDAAILKHILDLKIKGGYNTPVDAPKYSLEIQEGDIVDSDGKVAELLEEGDGYPRWIYLNGTFWVVKVDYKKEICIFLYPGNCDYIERVPGTLKQWRLKYIAQHVSDYMKRTPLKDLHPQNDVSYGGATTITDAALLEWYLNYKVSSNIPGKGSIDTLGVMEGDIIDSNGNVFEAESMPEEVPEWPGSRWIFLFGRLWELKKDSNDVAYIEINGNEKIYIERIPMSGSAFRAKYPLAYENEYKRVNNKYGVSFPSTGVDEEITDYFTQYHHQEIAYYYDLMELTAEESSAHSSYEIAINTYLKLTGKSEGAPVSEDDALSNFNSDVDNENREISKASRKGIEQLHYLQEKRSAREKYINDNKNRAALRYEFWEIAERVQARESIRMPWQTPDYNIDRLTIDFNILTKKIAVRGGKPDDNESKQLEKIKFEINYYRLLLKIKNNDQTEMPNYEIPYSKFTNSFKKDGYQNASAYVLFKIENDPSIPPLARFNAYEARMGKERVTEVDIYGYTLVNCFFIPDYSYAKTGVLVDLESPEKYYYVNTGSNLRPELINRLPFTSVDGYHLHPDGPHALSYLRTGKFIFEEKFNYIERAMINILDLSGKLFHSFDEDLEAARSRLDSSAWGGTNDVKIVEELAKNKNVLKIAEAGRSLYNPNFKPVKTLYTGQEIAPEAPLLGAKIVRGIAHPFETMAEEIQKKICIDNEDSVEEAKIKIKAAKRVGAWFDITFSAALVFVPGGAVISLTQATADISADIIEGKGVDPFVLSSLVVSLIPGGKVAKVVGRVSKTGAQIAKYGILIGQKTLDAAGLAIGIKTATVTGDPLHIYQACINAGMSALDARHTSRKIFNNLKVLQQRNLAKVQQNLQAKTQQSASVNHFDPGISAENLVQETPLTEKFPDRKTAGYQKANVATPVDKEKSTKGGGTSQKNELKTKTDLLISVKHKKLVKTLVNNERHAEIKNLSIVRRNVGHSYIQHYTDSPGKNNNVDNLVITAHGGFIDSDAVSPVVVLPSDITIKMLTPHNTYLIDPGLDQVVNASKNLKPYATISNGKVDNVNFNPQQSNPDWILTDIYNPADNKNTLGREDGLQNYRHYKFELESDELISEVLRRNRLLAEQGKTELTDVLSVDDKIADVGDTSLDKASVQKVIDLDKEGKLLNANGQRYKSIIFSHCRNHFLKPAESISSYYMDKLEVSEEKMLSKGASVSEVRITTLYRTDSSQPFTIQTRSMGKYVFRPVKKEDDSEDRMRRK